MKILLINWMDLANPLSGGAEVHLTELFARFVERGDSVTLVCSKFPGCRDRGVDRGIDIVRVGSHKFFNYAVPGAVRNLERSGKFDLIVEDINKIPFFTPLYMKKPTLAIIPHLFGSSVFHETNPLFASYVYLMERPIPFVYKQSTFEVISDSTKQDMIKRGIDSVHIRVIYCGMDHMTYNYDSTVNKFSQPTILCVGRLKKYKSIDIIIHALPEVLKCFPDARLAIIGSGDYYRVLKHMADTLHVSSNVIFTGFVSSEEKVDWMRRSHVIVNPSPKEGWGLTNIEANACGTPAIVSDVDGLRDSVRNGETGLLFPYGNVKVLSETLIRFFQDETLRNKLSENALTWAQKFTWDESARQTMEIADSLVMRNNLPQT